MDVSPWLWQTVIRSREATAELFSRHGIKVSFSWQGKRGKKFHLYRAYALWLHAFLSAGKLERVAEKKGLHQAPLVVSEF